MKTSLLVSERSPQTFSLSGGNTSLNGEKKFSQQQLVNLGNKFEFSAKESKDFKMCKVTQISFQKATTFCRNAGSTIVTIFL